MYVCVCVCVFNVDAIFKNVLTVLNSLSGRTELKIN